jgi:tRNA-dihydrouridine synthase
VLDQVAERFLGHSEQAQSHILGNIGRDPPVVKMHINLILIADFLAKAMNCGCQAHKLQLAGMELMRERPKVR